MSIHETPAVKAERNRRDEQNILWDKARDSARDLLDSNDENSWISTSSFLNYVQKETGVSHGVAIAVMQELRESGETVYTLSKGYKKGPGKSATEEEIFLRPADLERRNNFISFVDAMYKIENK